eukprot:scaffold29871_cov36-Phaeocystis_antarctica.AAC.2
MMRGEVRPGRTGGGGWPCGVIRAQGREARLQIGSRARGGGAHVEHVGHARDAGGVEAQRLGEGAGGREGGGRPRRKQRAWERARLQIWGRARGGAHAEHVAHVRDAGGVEAQRLVERRHVLPRVERKAYGAGQGACPGGRRRRATAVHATCRGGLDCRFGAGHGEERTPNM